MIQVYYYDLELLWSLLAKGVTFNGYDVEYTTDHVKSFPAATSSERVSAALIWQTTKRTLEDQFWFIDALSETKYPYALELSIRKTVGDSYRYACRLEQSQIVHLFERHCLDAFDNSGQYKPDYLGNYPIAENSMMQAIVDDLYYDPDSDAFRVRFVELSSLEAYLDTSLLKNKTHERDPQRSEPTHHGLAAINGGSTCSTAESEDSGFPEAMDQGLDPEEEATPSPSTPVSPRQQSRSPRETESALAGDRCLSYSSVHEVPRLVEQIQLAHSLPRRPPAIDRARSDTELDALATQVISELDQRSHLGEDAASVGGVEDGGRTGTGETRDQTLPHPETEPSAEEQMERASAMVLLLQKARTKTTVEVANPRTRQAFVMQPRPGLTPTRPTAAPPGTARYGTDMVMLGEDKERGDAECQVEETEGNEEAEEEEDEEEEDDETASFGGDDGSMDRTEKQHADDSQVSEEDSVRAALRGDFMKKFQASRFAGLPDHRDHLQAKLDEVVRQSKALAKRAMLRETHELVDRYGELNSRPKVTSRVDLSRVIEAMGVKPAYRSRESRGVIVDMLRSGCGLSPHLGQCGGLDLQGLSGTMELRVLRPDRGLAVADALHVRGEPILRIYIVLEGTLQITEYPAAAGKAAPSVSQFKGKAATTLVGYARTVGPGDCLGENVLQGEANWRIDIAIPSSPVTVCCLPLDAVLRFIGRRGEEVEGAMVLFWKHHRLWQEIKQHNQDLLRHSKYTQEVSGRGASAKTRQQLHFKFQPMNVIESARIKVFQPGMEVFVQGNPREYLFLVLRGCCDYRRAFPADLIAEGVMPPTVDVGLSLMCGDFSFMDGEDHLWLEKMQEDDERVAHTAEDSIQVRERRRAKYVRFETHRNSLVAVSRAEVALVPIAEIAKCMKLFVRLIKLATELYPAPFTADEELVRRHYEEVKWQAERGEVLKQVVFDRDDRTLNEQYFQAVDNNLSDSLYRQHTPGYRSGKLQISLAAAAAAAEAALAERSRGSILSQADSEMPVEERERRLVEAMEDLHTPRRALMEHCFSSIRKREMLNTVGSGKWSMSGSDKFLSSPFSARFTSGKYPSAKYSADKRNDSIPTLALPSQSAKAPPARPGPRPVPVTGPRAADRPSTAGSRRGRAPSPPSPPPGCPGGGSPGGRGSQTSSATAVAPQLPVPSTPQRPKSARSSTTRRSPRPHSAADAQLRRGANHTVTWDSGGAQRPQSSQELRHRAEYNEGGTLSNSRPGSAAAKSSHGVSGARKGNHWGSEATETDRPHRSSSQNPAAVGSSGSAKQRGTALTPHDFQFVVDADFLAELDKSGTIGGHSKRTDSASPIRNVDNSVSPPVPRPGHSHGDVRSVSPPLRPRSAVSTTTTSAPGSRPASRGSASATARPRGIDPEHFVQVYRARTGGSPTQRFLEEFMGRPHM